MISIDTETTGIDLLHDARPFLVTITKEDGTQLWWEWEVDPQTRMPFIPPEDLEEIREVMLAEDIWILHNAKFDLKALSQIHDVDIQWPWERVHDTLLGAHLLASNRPKDLTAQALVFLGVNIEPYEVALKEACTKARGIARSQFPEWKIAKVGQDGMPSVKGSEKVWKNDAWLPRAIALVNDELDSPWLKVTPEYANTDSAVTLPLFKAQQAEIARRGLEKIYGVRRKVLPIAYEMEMRGVTVNGHKLEELYCQFLKESEESGKACIDIALQYGVELDLPKSGNNKALRSFVFGRPGFGLDEPRDGVEVELKRSEKTGEPSLDKTVLEYFIDTLPSEQSQEYLFFQALSGKRKRDTAIAYMEGYTRFWLPHESPGFWVLHPSINPTGSDTLRWTSQNPNEQNISKQEGFNLRYMFGPAPGREWWSMDARNIELRIPAYEAGEQEMIELFERVDEPPFYGSNHLLNFSIVYPDLWNAAVKQEGIDKAGPFVKKAYASSWYQWCKNGGFKLQYGGLNADSTFHREGATRALKGKFNKLSGLNSRCIAFAEKHGYVETMPDKNVDPTKGYPLLCTRTEYGRILPTVPLNYHVQGTAMWWMMKAMIRCYEYLEEVNRQGFDGHIALQVHDELVFDLPAGSGSEPWKTNLPKARKLRRLMEEGGEDIGIPTPVSMEYHSESWSKGVTL